MDEQDVARAIAFFEACDDRQLLRGLVREIQPRAAAEVRRLSQQRRPIPPPQELSAAEAPANRDEALRTLKTVRDFSQLQALARAIGRRVEALGAP